MKFLKLFLSFHNFLRLEFLGGILKGLLGGGSGGGSSPYHPYSPTGLGQEDTNWQALFQEIMQNTQGLTDEAGQQLSPTYQNIEQVLAGPLGQDTQAMAAYGGAYDYNLASQTDALHNLMTNQGNVNYGAEQNLLGAGSQLYQTSLDPQGALEAQLQQQVTDASRAGTSARGIGTSAESAGIENQDVTNFLLNWQNQQLQRQATGLQGMDQAYTAAGQQGVGGNQSMIQAQQMAGLVPQLLQQSAQLPYQNQLGMDQTSYQNIQDIMQGGDTLMQPYYQMLNQIIPYLNYGTGAQANAFNAGQANIGNLTNLASAGSNLYQSLSSMGQGMVNPFSGVGAINPDLMQSMGTGGMDLTMDSAAFMPEIGAGIGADAGGMALGEGLGGLSAEDIALMFAV
jgi:hypothetical protein